MFEPATEASSMGRGQSITIANPSTLLNSGQAGAKQLRNPTESKDISIYKVNFGVVTPPGELKDMPEVMDRPTVAILPFKNMSSDPENEYFADGITEELITALSAIDRLKVISRTSAMQYKTTSKGVIEIAKELTADSLVEGSVRKSLNRVR